MKTHEKIAENGKMDFSAILTIKVSFKLTEWPTNGNTVI